MNHLLIFNPVYKTKIWGGTAIARHKQIQLEADNIGESWEISAMPGDETHVAQGPHSGATIPELLREYGARLVGKHVYSLHGTTFPLLTKYLGANTPLSIQVHPDDTMAQHYGEPFGKSEMWYVVDAEQGASLYCGTKEGTTTSDIAASLQDNTITSLLKLWPTHAGDLYNIPPGTIHALGVGNLILEIQQSSDRTYRLYDYNRPGLDGRPRELHIERGLEAIGCHRGGDGLTAYDHQPDTLQTILRTPCFTTSLCHLSQGSITLDAASLDSFIIIMVTRGSCTASSATMPPVTLKAGTSALLPATAELLTLQSLSSDCEIITANC